MSVVSKTLGLKRENFALKSANQKQVLALTTLILALFATNDFSRSFLKILHEKWKTFRKYENKPPSPANKNRGLNYVISKVRDIIFHWKQCANSNRIVPNKRFQEEVSNFKLQSESGLHGRSSIVCLVVHLRPQFIIFNGPRPNMSMSWTVHLRPPSTSVHSSTITMVYRTNSRSTCHKLSWSIVHSFH